MNRQSRPFYAQVYDSLSQGIREGSWGQGDILPSESELCAQFGVSRTVVRRALQELEYEGLIIRKQGKGSFVAERKLQELLLQRLTGFYQDMLNQGHKIRNRVLRQEIVRAGDDVRAALMTKENEEIILIERLRYVDGIPVNLSISYVPQKRCPSLLFANLAEGSLYTYLETETGQHIVRGRRTIEAIRATPSLSELLETDADLPFFKITNTCYLADGAPIEYSLGYHRCDRTQFHVELVRTGDLESPPTGPVPSAPQYGHTLT